MTDAKPAKFSKFKRPLAIGVSLALHVLLLTAFAVTTTSNLANVTAKGDGDAVAGVQIDLVGVHDSSNPKPAVVVPPETKRMNDFMQMLATPTIVVDSAVTKPSPAKSITEALGENPFEAKAAKTSDEGHVKLNDQNNKTINDLWKAIAPCWNRIADKNSLDVTLEVSFSPMGNLSKPPIIHRTAGVMLDDRVLRSESQAITALAQCGPYLTAYGQEHVQVSFPKKG